MSLALDNAASGGQALALLDGRTPAQVIPNLPSNRDRVIHPWSSWPGWFRGGDHR
ncbi:MAG: hypothetical protein ACRDIY_00355 [Chloroflexota bacterium]